MRRPNPFSGDLRGPRNDYERAVIRESRKRENAPPPTPEGLEHIPNPEHVQAYLDKRFPGDPTKKDLCKYSFACDVWTVEDLLMQDLAAAKESKNAALAQELRGLIRAASWSSHRQKEPEVLRSEAKAIVDELKGRRAELSRTDPEEAKAEDPQIHQAEELLAALEQKKGGERAEAAMQAIEEIYARELLAFHRLLRLQDLTLERAMKMPSSTPVGRALHRLAKKLRPLRDQIAFQRLYPSTFSFARPIRASQASRA